MARKGGIGGKKDRLFINNVAANGKEDFQLNSKLANLEVQKHKEMARWEIEKSKLSLPSLRKNGGISLTHHHLHLLSVQHEALWYSVEKATF